MNVFAKFDEFPSMTLQDIKETKRYGHTFVRSFVSSDNVKTVYPPTNTVCGGYKLRESDKSLITVENYSINISVKIKFYYPL